MEFNLGRGCVRLPTVAALRRRYCGSAAHRFPTSAEVAAHSASGRRNLCRGSTNNRRLPTVACGNRGLPDGTPTGVHRLPQPRQRLRLVAHCCGAPATLLWVGGPSVPNLGRGCGAFGIRTPQPLAEVGRNNRRLPTVACGNRGLPDGPPTGVHRLPQPRQRLRMVAHSCGVRDATVGRWPIGSQPRQRLRRIRHPDAATSAEVAGTTDAYPR
jgi:hypothetical protein